MSKLHLQCLYMEVNNDLGYLTTPSIDMENRGL